MSSLSYEANFPQAVPVRVGQTVPDFEMDTFDPVEHGFGKMSLAENKKAKKWTVLVFYPADYTFVCPTELADVAEQHGDQHANLHASRRGQRAGHEQQRIAGQEGRHHQAGFAEDDGE